MAVAVLLLALVLLLLSLIWLLLVFVIDCCYLVLLLVFGVASSYAPERKRMFSTSTFGDVYD